MDRAYRRCGFVGWFGTHRLRHSFATRLYARGATTKEIADLLGHRLVATTDHYIQTKDLQPLAQPWPFDLPHPN
jgi:integrase